MSLIRISNAKPLNGFQVELTLTTDEVLQRDLRPFLEGPIFDVIRNDEERFRQLRAHDGTIVWPNGADLCPDVLIWGGLPPADPFSRAAWPQST